MYAKQWRFRSTNNLVHNADFFFNNGSLDGNELIRQMIQVVVSYEFIGVKIFGIVSDAGGGNTKMFKLLQGHNVVKGPWPDAKCLSFVNPADKDRSIYMWSCGTHNFKALRNNLYRSQLVKAKSLMNYGVPFGWNEIEVTYERDVGRLQKNMPQRTDLNKHSVYLDNYTLMNASYAKKCFSEKTITEMIVYVAKSMEVKLEIGLKFESQWHQLMSTCNSLKEKVTDTTPLVDQSYIAIIQYQIAVHGIYIERLLNKKWRLTRDNILSEKEILKKSIRYFTEWRHQKIHVMSTMKMNRKDTDKFYMADQTFNNLLQCVGGFFAYSEAILGLNNDGMIQFIPALHCNQSSLENFFSRMRQLDKDRTDLYAGGVLQQNVMNDIHSSQKKRKVGNSSYPEWMIDNEHSPVRKETRIGETVIMKKKTISNSIKSALVLLGVEEVYVSKVALEFVSVGSAFGNIFTNEIKDLELPEGLDYQTYCLSDLFFQGYYSLSLNTLSERWFTSFIDKINREHVNSLCAAFSNQLFNLLEESLMEGNKKKQSFQLQILSFIQSNGISKLCDDMPTNLKQDKSCILMLFMFLSRKLIDDWLPKIIRKRRTKMSSIKSESSINNTINPFIDGEVNRIVGWALFSCINKYQKIKKKQEGDYHNSTDDTILFYEDMKAIESEILQNKEYIRRYYFTDDAIRNKGKLTLISPYYIEPFSKLSQFISNKYQSIVKMKKTSKNVKIEVEKEFTIGNQVNLVNEIVAKSKI